MNTSSGHAHVCPFCEGMCGVKITVEQERVVSVRPDPDNVWSQGHVCPKGTYLGETHHDPDRIRRPLVRVGKDWREVSWEAAFARIREILEPVIAKHGREAIACYLGNMSAKGFASARYVGQFFRLSGVTNVYSSSTNDQHPKNVVCQLMYGNMWRIPIPDVDRTDLFLIMGGNPAASKGSIWSHRDAMGSIRALRARGGRVIVIDPVRTATAERADQWIGIRPGTDAALLLAVAHTLFAEGAVHLDHLAPLVDGLETVRRLVERFAPERVESFCGVPAGVIRELARELARTARSSIYGRIGLCTQEFGTLASWMVEVLAVLTGNLDREGGTLWSTQLASHQDLTAPYPTDAPIITGYSRVRGAAAVLGQFPSSCLEEEIATPGAGQIKVLITFGANPVITAPASARLDAALGTLQGMICLDNYINETTRHAHVILPSPSTLEQPHWDVWAWPFALKSGGHYSRQLFPTADRPEDWTIYTRLGALLGGEADADLAAIDNAYFASLCDMRKADRSVAFAASPVPGPERILDLAIRTGPYGDHYGKRPAGLNLESFKQAPTGIIMGDAKPLGAAAFSTSSGQLELAPEYITNDIPRLEAAIGRPKPAMVLVSRRQLASLNSWLHNFDGLVKGHNRFSVYLHPDDAARIGVVQHEVVRIKSTEGEIDAPVEITDIMSVGVASVPHGWGHTAPGTRLNVARHHAGANSNILCPGTFVDAISGNAAFNGIPVVITRAS
jgi:anaerobic selenocysteine-containing dehydrogenase